jgi:UDP-glucuronate decarboxylase
VDDTVAGLISLWRGGERRAVNLGNPGEVTMLELAERVLRLTCSRSRLVFRPLPADDPRRRCPDISRAQNSLGWRPSVVLEDGLQRTIDWFRRALTGDSSLVAARCA